MPFAPDLGQVLDALRRQVFDDQEYYFLPGDDGLPASIEELLADELVQDEGTHSIIDVFRVIGPGDDDRDGTLRPLRPEESQRYFGSVTPTRAAFEKAYADRGEERLSLRGRRWSGHSTVLYDETGVPSEIAIWGYSGD